MSGIVCCGSTWITTSASSERDAEPGERLRIGWLGGQGRYVERRREVRLTLRQLRDVYRHGPAVRRDVLALRAVQSMAVLDVRNYRDLVLRIGEFEADGEDPELGRALP